MAPPPDPRRLGRGAPYQHDTSSATLVALLLVIAVPALVIALAAGWRPVSPEQAAEWQQWAARLVNRGTPASAATAPSADWSVPNGWFYTQVSGPGGEPGKTGYPVTDADGMPFWSDYQRLGGPTFLGYPISRRFTADGATRQAFQRAVLRFDPAAGAILPQRLLDRLHDEGHDPNLATQWGIPALELPAPPDATAETLQERLGPLSEDQPAFGAYLSGLSDPFAVYGLPTSTLQDAGAFYVVRFQGGALQLWKQDVPWARAGDVTAANVGEIAATLGLVPTQALIPLPATRGTAVAVQ
jgi:hypothetical protein